MRLQVCNEVKRRVEPFSLLNGGWGRLPWFPKHFASIQNNVKTFTSLHTFVFCMFLWVLQRSRVFKTFHIFCEYAFSFLALNQYNILFYFYCWTMVLIKNDVLNIHKMEIWLKYNCRFIVVLYVFLFLFFEIRILILNNRRNQYSQNLGFFWWQRFLIRIVYE